MTITKQNNDVIDHIGVFYAKNENEYTLKINKELSWSNWVQSVMKARQDNNVIDCIGLVDVKTETELSRPIWLGVVCDEN